ncbi:hypothetical protein [Escherichia coli]
MEKIMFLIALPYNLMGKRLGHQLIFKHLNENKDGRSVFFAKYPAQAGKF